MNDDKTEEQMRRIRELQDKIEVFEHERRQELRRDVLADGVREKAITAAIRAGLLGSTPSLIWLYFASNFTSGLQLALEMLCVTVPVLFVAAAAGLGSGMFAHWWFANSIIPVRRAAILMALLADTVILGWLIALTT